MKKSALTLTIFAEWFVDVQDTARLHVAALTNPEVKNERIIAYSEHFTWKYVRLLIFINVNIANSLAVT